MEILEKWVSAKKNDNTFVSEWATQLHKSVSQTKEKQSEKKKKLTPEKKPHHFVNINTWMEKLFWLNFY